MRKMGGGGCDFLGGGGGGRFKKVKIRRLHEFFLEI